MQSVTITRTTNDNYGRVYFVDKEYEIDAVLAQAFFAKGTAIPTVERLTAKMAKFGAGLLVGAETDPSLVRAATEAGLKVSKGK